MALKAFYTRETFEFSFGARTSRGPMKDKVSWFIKIWDELKPEVIGIGECGPLPGLSIDDRPDFESVLASVLQKLSLMEYSGGLSDQHIAAIIPPGFPSITFGLETALLDLAHGGRRIIFENSFIKGRPIPINGLIWMGDFDFMIKQIDQKIAGGFQCIKLKVGAIDFERECEVIAHIRKKYAQQKITIRLDANGGFSPTNALQLLEKLAKFDIHSIEQPIAPGLPEMFELCRDSPIPIALDEELIGIETYELKVELLKRLKPQFIILKPTLHGGLSGCREWIEIAESLCIAWWMTSALESNIGLNAICQFTANYPKSIPQGLGTGTIYVRNIESPLQIANGNITHNNSSAWRLDEFNTLR